mmetsp:Transcript_23205/g.17630  ORF Transcript_23205/g.17630 Transcript_23205/m.17630 type:complete len:169 (+) Transcript_23205:532-1038(+)
MFELAKAEEDKEEARVEEWQRLLKVGNARCEKKEFELVEFEEQVGREGGCWLRFNKLPPPEEEQDPKAPQKKQPPPKAGKGGVVEEMKPVFGRGWLDFTDLQKPGATEIKQRVFLETCRPLVKKMGENNMETYVEAEGEFEPTFEPSRCYIYLKLTLSDPVTPPEQSE